MMHKKIIIFTDLDGCFLDHDNYSFSSAKPLLEQLKQYEIPLIINSSKTKLEIASIQKEMAIDTPYIVENGAAVVFNSIQNTQHFAIDNSLFKQSAYPAIKEFSISREKLLSITNKIKEKHNFKYKGFSDMTTEQISVLTQLSLDDSFAAGQRDFSEPIVWQDSQSRQITFKKLLAEENISLHEGGRFFHMSSQCSKGEAMQWLLKQWQVSNPVNKTVIALGDSMNDVSMLNQSDYAIVIKNKLKELNVQGKIQTIYSHSPGTSGWVETLTPLLNQLIPTQGNVYE